MKKDTIRAITIELVKMAIIDLGEITPGDPKTFDPICNAVATGISTAIKLQCEELRHFAQNLKPDTRALLEGWIAGKQLEAGLPPTLPDWYPKDPD